MGLKRNRKRVRLRFLCNIRSKFMAGRLEYRNNVIDELQGNAIQNLHDTQTQTCVDYMNDLTFFARATLSEIKKELKKRGGEGDGVKIGGGIFGGPAITDGHSTEDCCAEMRRLQDIVKQLTKQNEMLQSNIENAQDDIANLKKGKDDLNIHAMNKLNEFSDRVDKLDTDVGKTAKDTAGMGKDLIESMKLVKDISDIQLKNAQLTSAVNAITTRDDEKIIADLRRQLLEEQERNRKCLEENKNLQDAVVKRGIDPESARKDIIKESGDTEAKKAADAPKDIPTTAKGPQKAGPGSIEDAGQTVVPVPGKIRPEASKAGGPDAGKIDGPRAAKIGQPDGDKKGGLDAGKEDGYGAAKDSGPGVNKKDEPDAAKKGDAGKADGPDAGKKDGTDAAKIDVPDTGKKVRPDAGGKDGPGTSKVGVPDAGKKDGPDVGKIGEPEDNKKGGPDAGKAGGPDAGKKGEPDAGKKDSPGASKVSGPDVGKKDEPRAGKVDVPETGIKGGPDAGKKDEPRAGKVDVPETGIKGGPDAGKKDEPRAGKVDVPETGIKGGPDASKKDGLIAAKDDGPGAGKVGGADADKKDEPGAGKKDDLSIGNPNAVKRDEPIAAKARSPDNDQRGELVTGAVGGVGIVGGPDGGKKGRPEADNKDGPGAGKVGVPETGIKRGPVAGKKIGADKVGGPDATKKDKPEIGQLDSIGAADKGEPGADKIRGTDVDEKDKAGQRTGLAAAGQDSGPGADGSTSLAPGTGRAGGDGKAGPSGDGSAAVSRVGDNIREGEPVREHQSRPSPGDGKGRKAKISDVQADDAFQQFIDYNANAMITNIKTGSALEKELRAILNAFMMECGFCFCKSLVPKSKFYALCHKLLHNGIQCMSFRELVYMHRKVIMAADKLQPGCLINMILTEQGFKDGEGSKCCHCKNALCCSNSEEMLKEKVCKLERDVEMAKEYLDNLRMPPRSPKSPYTTNSRTYRQKEDSFSEAVDELLTCRETKPALSKTQSKQMKTLKARIMKCSELLR